MSLRTALQSDVHTSKVRTKTQRVPHTSKQAQQYLAGWQTLVRTGECRHTD